MAATVQVEELTGGSDGSAGSYTVKDDGSNNSRYYTTDSNSASDTTNPIPIPNTVDGGVSGSYWKTHLLNVTAEPSEYIENVRFYVQWSSHPSSQWALGYGGDHIIGVSSATYADCRVYTNGFPSSSYDVANGVEGELGYLISGNGGGSTRHPNDHEYYSGCTNGRYVSTWGFSSQAGALMVYSGQILRTGGVIAAGGSGNTVGRTYAVCTQVLVASGATQESKTAVTATWVYDEV